jgi:hypothetical protein
MDSVLIDVMVIMIQTFDLTTKIIKSSSYTRSHNRIEESAN